MHTHIHTDRQTDTHKCLHTKTHNHKSKHTNTRTYTHTYRCIHIHVHTHGHQMKFQLHSLPTGGGWRPSFDTGQPTHQHSLPLHHDPRTQGTHLVNCAVTQHAESIIHPTTINESLTRAQNTAQNTASYIPSPKHQRVDRTHPAAAQPHTTGNSMSSVHVAQKRQHSTDKTHSTTPTGCCAPRNEW